MRPQIRYMFVGSVVFAILLNAFQPAAAQYTNPYNGVSHSSQIAKFYDMTSTWNSNLWSAMNRVEATKNRLNSLARSNGDHHERLIITAQMAGAQQNDSAMLSQARELSRGVLKNLLGVEAP
jgi:hypothetical protein